MNIRLESNFGGVCCLATTLVFCVYIIDKICDSKDKKAAQKSEKDNKKKKEKSEEKK